MVVVVFSRGVLEMLVGLGIEMFNVVFNFIFFFSLGVSIRSKDSNEGILFVKIVVVLVFL